MTFKLALLAIPLVSVSTALIAQVGEGRIPNYPVPYTYPTAEGVTEVLNRVRGYYESTSTPAPKSFACCRMINSTCR